MEKSTTHPVHLTTTTSAHVWNGTRAETMWHCQGAPARNRRVKASSFGFEASTAQLVKALENSNQTTLAELPLHALNIGRPGKDNERHTRLVAHLAGAMVIIKSYQRIDLNFGLPSRGLAPLNHGSVSPEGQAWRNVR
jgi:hypothetical protein